MVLMGSCVLWASSADLEKMNSLERISFLQEKLQDIRNHYLSLKSEVASIDRRRKRMKKKERESECGSLWCRFKVVLFLCSCFHFHVATSWRFYFIFYLMFIFSHLVLSFHMNILSTL